MFEQLSSKLTDVFSNLRKKGALTEADIDAAMREIRVALLEADVALPVAKEFINSLKEKALGQEIIASVSPAQMVVKLTQDHLTELLGSEHSELNTAAQPPAVILMCGLQGSGKTTSTGKLANLLKSKQQKKVMVASLDVYRPAAQEQLRQVAGQADVSCLPIVEGQQPQDITKRALKAAKEEGADVLILDTAGRLHVDDELMQELIEVKKLSNPVETLLVADSLTGQDAVNIAKSFHEAVDVTGIILTRVDGDGRGGAALSMRQVTGQPIKFLGVGEKLDALEPFHPERIASRILDMGDVVSLVEKAAEVVDEQEAEKLAKKMAKGEFTLEDMLQQFKQMQKMGGIGSMLNMLPGMGAMKDQIAAAGGMDESMFKRSEAIILSMTKRERKFPKLLNASRRMRIAQGSGVEVQDVNKLIKQHQQMEKMMKKMKKMGKKGMNRGGMQQLMQQMGGPGALPPGMPKF